MQESASKEVRAYMARLASRGGFARAKNLSAAQLSAIGRKAGLASAKARKQRAK